MRKHLHILLLIMLAWIPGTIAATEEESEKVDVKEIIFEHLSDDYEWHIAEDVVLHFPCIIYDDKRGLQVFMSDKLDDGAEYNGYHIDTKSGKIVNAAGARPFDISITKDVLELFLVCFLLCLAVLSTAHWYKRNGYMKAPGGFVGLMETLVNFIDKDVASASIGVGYERFSPYLNTVFLFILTCNLIGLIPIFPGGANLTGNIAVTLTCAVTAFIAINFFAPKEYFKSIFWPHVPLALKAIPLMPTIEFIGVFTKPFSLTVRLFANIMAGHIIILSLTSIIFIAWKEGPAIGSPMTVVSVAFCIFMNCLELLVAFIQAYVFTILTANFIGLAQHEE